MKFLIYIFSWEFSSIFFYLWLKNCNDDQNIKYQNYSEIPKEWPREYGDLFEKSKTDDEENDRPDSGVGESVSFT